MARTNTQNVTKLHNVGAIHDAIVSAFPKILADEMHRKELYEEHIREVQEGITAQFKRLSADCDIPIKVLKYMFRGYMMEQEAEQFEDENDRDKVRDGLRLAFGAMVKGKTLSFLDVLEDENFLPERLKADAAMAASANADAEADAAAVSRSRTKH